MRKLLLLLALASITLGACADDSQPASSRGEGGGEFSGEDSEEFCELAREYQETFESAGEAETQEDLGDEYEDFAEAVDDLAEEAPDEIKADIEVVAGAFGELNELLEKYDYDFSKVPEAEAEAIDIDNPEIEAANRRINTYFEDVCGIEDDDDDDDDDDDEEQAPGGDLEPSTTRP